MVYTPILMLALKIRGALYVEIPLNRIDMRRARSTRVPFSPVSSGMSCLGPSCHHYGGTLRRRVLECHHCVLGKSALTIVILSEIIRIYTFLRIWNDQ